MRDLLGRRRRPSDAHEDDRLSALLDDELPEAEAIEVARHVAACRQCAAELEALRRLRNALRALPPLDPPRELYAAVDARIGAMRPGRSRRGWRLLSALGASFALAAAAAVAAGGATSDRVTPPVDVFVADHLARTETAPVFRPVDLGR